MFEELEEKTNIRFICKDTALISYPKSGRTWLRLQLAKLNRDRGFPPSEYETMPALHYDVKKFIHFFGTDVNVVFLHRDPGDVVVSHFYELAKANGLSQSTSSFSSGSEFIRDPEFGIKRIIDYNNEWFLSLERFKSHTVISYEDMKKDASRSLQELCEYLRIDASPALITDCVEYCTFENMKKIDQGEGENYITYHKGNFGKSPGRVRRGVVKGYVDDLSEEDLKYVEEAKRMILDSLETK